MPAASRSRSNARESNNPRRTASMGLRQVSAELASGFLLLILKKAVGHPTPRPERRTGPAYAAFPSPRLRGRSRSRRPGALADRFGAAKARHSPAGRGRNVRRAAQDQARLMVRNGFDCRSLSHRERVRVRGNHRNSDPACLSTPGTLELRESCGEAGGFPGSP